MTARRPFLIALQFLTAVPIRLEPPPEPAEIGASLVWYPAVGALLGAALVLLGLALAGASGLLPAALVLAAWVAATGALHLDGLADTADAWLGGAGDRERTLAIMKDPRSGPAAVVALVVVLLLKAAAIDSLLRQGAAADLAAAPVLGRAALVWLFLAVPYVRAGGLGTALARHGPRRGGWLAVGLAALAVLLATAAAGVRALLAVALVAGLFRAWLLRRLGGTTGDTAGALVELAECAGLVAMALG